MFTFRVSNVAFTDTNILKAERNGIPFIDKTSEFHHLQLLAGREWVHVLSQRAHNSSISGLWLVAAVVEERRGARTPRVFVRNSPYLLKSVRYIPT